MSVSETALPAGPSRGRVRGPSRRIQLPWLAAAAGLAVLVALIVLWGFGRVADRREVVTIAQPVEAGAPIPAEALGFTMVAIDSPSNRLFSAGQADQLVGLLATVDLAPGDLLGPSMVSGRPALPDTWVEVGAVLRAGWYPVSLVAGDDLWAISSSGDTQIRVLVIEHHVTSDRVNVVLGVDPAQAAQLARWSAGGELVLIRIPPGPDAEGVGGG